jgi:hypothetical protein
MVQQTSAYFGLLRAWHLYCDNEVDVKVAKYRKLFGTGASREWGDTNEILYVLEVALGYEEGG